MPLQAQVKIVTDSYTYQDVARWIIRIELQVRKLLEFSIPWISLEDIKEPYKVATILYCQARTELHQQDRRRELESSVIS